MTDAEIPADDLYDGPELCRDCGNCQSTCPMQAHKGESVKIHLEQTVIDLPLIDRNRCDWSKRYALCKEEGPEMIGNKTDIPKPAGTITINDIAEACTQRDQIMKRRPCILESCLRNCPA